MAYFSNHLSPAKVERLAILLEELGEAQQAIGKILRHGYESCHPDANECMESNRRDLERELGDVRYAINLMEVARDVSQDNIIGYALEKVKKAKPYLHHQDSRSGEGAHP